MKTLVAFIAKLGESPNFIAWNAHMFAAAFIVSLFHGTALYFAAGVAVILAAGKEFWFDRLYEQMPPQTFQNDFTDFLGYVAGVILAIGVH